jgi:hypothetical protein
MARKWSTVRAKVYFCQCHRCWKKHAVKEEGTTTTFQPRHCSCSGQSRSDDFNLGIGSETYLGGLSSSLE